MVDHLRALLSRPRAARGSPGFTLVETLVALAIVSLLLLSGLALAAVEARTQRRLVQHAEAERALATAYERLRAGLLPLVAGDVAVEFAVDGGTIGLEVEPAAAPALYEIRLIARYRAGGGDFERRLEALLWRP